MIRDTINITNEINKTVDFWNTEFSKGLIYGDNPSQAAIKTSKLLLKKGILGTKFNLLEIGGGYGRNAKYFIDYLNLNTTLFDISDNAIELAKKYTSNCFPGLLNLVLGDVADLNSLLPKAYYDVVFHNFCLHLLCFKDRDRIYSNVSTVLKPGGIFIGSYLSVNDPDCPDPGSGKEVTAFIRGKDQHFFTAQEIRKELNPFFNIEAINEGHDLEEIISEVRQTTYYYVIGIKK